MKWNLELTDTFGGEANYSWCNRETIELRPVGACVMAFVLPAY